MRKYAYPIFWALVCAAAAWAVVSFRGLPPPRLVVVIVVDQLRPDYLTRFADLYEGGFHTLLDNGANFTNSAYRHASTYTAAGHASVSTGLHPAAHGVIANSWYDSARGAVVNCIADDEYAAVGGSGRRASPRPLLADTLGDLLKRKHGGSKVYAFSSKDRAALLLAGRGADGAFWYSDPCGCFVTSSYYANGLPEWLAAFNAAKPAAAYAGKRWERLLADRSLYEKLAREDDFPTEADGQATTFPHALPEEDVEAQVQQTPFADELTLQAALAALDSGELGADGEPDLLAIGFSATDRIGHRYGPYSQEAMDHNLRLDRLLADLLAAIDRRAGLDKTVVALTADHGVLPLVEELQRRGAAARRVDPDAFWQRARDALKQRFPDAPDLVAEASGNRLYWRLAAFRNGAVERAEAEKFLTEQLRRDPLVADVHTASDLAGASADAPETLRLFANAYFERRSPHVFVHFKEFVYAGGAHGTGHGSAHAYDREVPVLLYGAGIRQGTFERPAGPEDIAPTLARLLRLEMPKETDTRILAEALR